MPCLGYGSRLVNAQGTASKRWQKADWLAVGGLLVLVCLFVGRAFLPGKVLLPLDVVTQLWPPWQQPSTAVDVHNPLITDVVDYIYPLKTFMAAQVKDGTVPLWNPYVLGGYPLTYNTQAGLWYPLSLLYVALPPVTAVDLTVFLQMALGGLFMFAYLRQVALRRAAAFLGAVLFLFNGMMIVWLEWQVVHAAVVWLPLCLYFVERVYQRLRGDNPSLPYKDVILAGFAFAMPWLGGHWNWALYGSMTAVVYILWRFGSLFLAQKLGSPKRQKEAAWLGVLILGVGIGLSAIQVLPAFAYISRGHRQPFALAESLGLGLKNRAVVGLIPDFFGSPVQENWWGPTNYNETAFYLGILPLFLAVLALFLRQDGLTRFYAVWGALGVLWALGTPAYALLWALPVFNGLWPSRAMTVLVFCAAVLSALALDKLLATAVNWRKVRLAVIMVTAVILAGLLAYFWWYQPEIAGLRSGLAWFGVSLLAAVSLLFARPYLSPGHFAFLVLAFVVIDLFWAGYDYNTVGDVADLYPETETARFLHSDPELYRIATLPEGVAYPPNTALQDRIPALSGYEPAILQNWVDYISAAEGLSRAEGWDAIYFERELMPLHGLESPLLAAVNLKYVVTISDWYQEVSLPGPAQAQTGHWQPLTDTAVTHPITVPDAGLHRIDLPLQVAAGATGTVIGRILTPEGGQELAHAAWDVAQPLVDGQASFYFGAFPSEWGRHFLLTAEFVGEGEVQIGWSAAGLAFRTFYLPRPRLIHEAGKTRVYLNEGYFPRAYIVPQALIAPDAAQALARVIENQERLEEVVILEIDTQVEAYMPGGVGTAVVTEYDLNRVIIHTDTNGPGYLVLADTYYPGWQASVDGQPADIYRANSVVRAVAVPAGSHEVVFVFRPVDFYLGAAMTAVTLLVCAIVWAWWGMYHRQSHET